MSIDASKQDFSFLLRFFFIYFILLEYVRTLSFSSFITVFEISEICWQFMYNKNYGHCELHSP